VFCRSDGSLFGVFDAFASIAGVGWTVRETARHNPGMLKEID